jgi:hypothetical protein
MESSYCRPSIRELRNLQEGKYEEEKSENQVGGDEVI